MRIKILALLAVILPSMVQADYKDFVEVEMAGQIVEITTPPWSYAGFHHIHTEEFSASSKTPSGGEFYLTEFIPKGETFGEQGEMYGGWSRLYAIALETNVQQSAEEIMIGQLAIYYNACEEIDWQRTKAPTPSAEAFLIVCSSFKDKPDVGEFFFTCLLKMKRCSRTTITFEHLVSTRATSPQAIEETLLQMRSTISLRCCSSIIRLFLGNPRTPNILRELG